MAPFGLTQKQLLIGGAVLAGGVILLPMLMGGGVGGRGSRIVMLNQRDRNEYQNGAPQSPPITSPLIDLSKAMIGTWSTKDGTSPAPTKPGNGGGSDPEKKPEPDTGSGQPSKPRKDAAGGQMGPVRQKRWNQQVERAKNRQASRIRNRNLAGQSTVTVRRGDTAWGIAERAYGNGARWRDIAAANRDQLPGSVRFNGDPNTVFQLIRPGQRLRLPE